VRHLLIVAHGSRREDSNHEVMRLADQVRALPDLPFAAVATAFLELAEPSIPDALERCASEGASEIVLFPYFLAAGRHVAEDIPEAIGPFCQAHPHIAVRITPHLGASALLPQAVAGLAYLG